MNNKNKKTLRLIVREIVKYLGEATTTGDVAGYNTPFAFSSEDDEEKKKERLINKDYEFVDETFIEEIEDALSLSENRWLQMKKDETRTNHRKVADATSKIRKDLIEVKKYLNWCLRIRSENDLSKNKFHKRTQRNIKKIDSIVDEIRMKTKKFKI